MLKILLATMVTSWACDAARILVVFPSPSKSHAILGDGLVDHLLKAGHEVTYITPFPNNVTRVNLVEIDTSSSKIEKLGGSLNVKSFLAKNFKKPKGAGSYFFVLLELSIKTFHNENVQKLVKDRNQQFDVVIAEWLYTEYNAGYATIFNCPLIWKYTQESHWLLLNLIGEPVNPAYSLDNWSFKILPLSFWQRVDQLWTHFKDILTKEYYFYNFEKKEYEKSFGPVIAERGGSLPPFEDVRYNASLSLNNWHFSLGTSKTSPKNSIDVAGQHISDDFKPLPETIKLILDNAKNGVIYFSMGSIFKSKDLPEEMKRSLVEMFGKLKYTVIWKFEDTMPGLPDNVHIFQWAPQTSILAHKNCVLFITHGGLLSSTEAVHFGVPIIGIPIFGDQFGNIDQFTEKGFAKRVDLTNNVSQNLKIAIEDILSDKKYTKAVKDTSFIYHHRPVPPGKEMVHWVEHVIQTRGAPHLRSPAFMVFWYQRMYLDLVMLIILLLIILNFAVKTLKKSQNKSGKEKQS